MANDPYSKATSGLVAGRGDHRIRAGEAAQHPSFRDDAGRDSTSAWAVQEAVADLEVRPAAVGPKQGKHKALAEHTGLELAGFGGGDEKLATVICQKSPDAVAAETELANLWT